MAKNKGKTFYILFKIFTLVLVIYIIFACVIYPVGGNKFTQLINHPGEEWEYWVNTSWQNASDISDLKNGWINVEKAWEKKTGIDIDWDTAINVVTSKASNINPPYFKRLIAEYMEDQYNKKMLPFVIGGGIIVIPLCYIFGYSGKPSAEEREQQSRERLREQGFKSAKDNYAYHAGQLANPYRNRSLDSYHAQEMAKAEADLHKYSH